MNSFADDKSILRMFSTLHSQPKVILLLDIENRREKKTKQNRIHEHFAQKTLLFTLFVLYTFVEYL